MKNTSFHTQMLSQAWKKKYLPSQFKSQRKESERAVARGDEGSSRDTYQAVDAGSQSYSYRLKFK